MSPISRADLVIDRRHVDTVAAWMGTCRPGDVLVLSNTSPGCGVTTMLETLERESPSITFVTNSSGYGTMTVLGEKKILLIDPFDEYMVDQTKQKRALEYLHTRDLPIIVAGIRRRVSKAKIDDAFGTVAKRHGLTKVHIETPNRSRAIECLERLGIEHAGSVWDASGGDFRHCIESASMQQRAATTPSTQFVRDTIPDGIEALQQLLSTPRHTYKDAVRMADGDINLFLDGVYENYHTGITSLDTAGDILDVLARCDTLQNYIYHDPSSEFPEIAGLLAGVEFLPCCVTKKITKHGTIWAKENHRYTKLKLVRTIKSRGIDVETASYIRAMVCQNPREHGYRLAKAYGPQVVWNATRLWMKRAAAAGYTKKLHEDVTRPRPASN
jgi:hypothetical protein